MLIKPIFNNLIQVGMVVSNLEQSMQKYVYNYGIGPMYVIEFNPGNVSDMYLYGKRKNYSMNLGVSPIGDVRFELIEPISGSIYSDYLNQFGEGIIHHLKLGVDNYYDALKYMESLGIKIIQMGHQLGNKGKNMYTYLDTAESLGFIIEVVNVERDFIKPKPDYWFPDNKEVVPKPIFLRPSHVGIVVKDLAYKIKQYKDLFGLKPWTVKEFSNLNVADMYVYGKKKDYALKVGFYSLKNVQVKLIEPLSESIFSDFYSKYGEGIIHHLGMSVEDYNSALTCLKSKDIKIIQSGCYQDKFKYSYLSTGKDLNFIIEIVDCKDRDLNLL